MAVVPPTVGSAAPASLYVGDLHPDVTNRHVFDHFSEFKSLASVRVCRDSSTGRSLCYGYVNYLSPLDAIRAIEVKNHSVLNGKVIRVMWSHRDPDARKSGVGNLFVKNLGESIDNAKLQEMFQDFGNILSSKVAMSDDGKSKGYGFVQFESEDSANAAIEKLNGSSIGGKQMFVGKFVRKSDRILPSTGPKYTNLYVKNLDPDVTEEVLRAKFSEFGKVLSLAISKDDNGDSRGFGFVNFESTDDARRAVEAMNGSQLGSKVLYVARAQKKAEREQILRHQFEEKRNEQILKYQGSNVYVKNIEDDVTDDEFREHFSQCGTITSAKLMRDEKGISKGFGFVCFSTSEEAYKAVNTFHGEIDAITIAHQRSLTGYILRKKPLYVAIAQRKDERQAQLQVHYAQQLSGLAGPSTFIPGGYPPLYYAAPPAVVSHVSPRPGMVYQPMGLRPGWVTNGFAPPTGPSFQQPSQSPLPVTPRRQQRQSRGRMSRHMLPPGTDSYVPLLQQPSQSLTSSRDLSNQQRTGQVRYVPNGRLREMSKGSGISPSFTCSGGNGSEGSEMLSSKLSAATPEKQKQMLGERLYPLVQKHKPDHASKITGMILEMDNSELLLLLESPESLATRVEEAVKVLELAKTKVSDQDSLHSSYLSAEVTVN